MSHSQSVDELCKLFLTQVTFLELEVRVVSHRPELPACNCVEEHCRDFVHKVAEPCLIVALHAPQELDDDSRKVYVRDDHHVELSEEHELGDVACGLAVNCRGLTVVLDAPHNRKQHRTAADDINEMEEVVPREISPRNGRLLVQDDLRNVAEHLQRHDEHDDVLFARRQEGLDERVARADEHNDREEHKTSREGEEVVDVAPTFGFSVVLDEEVHPGLADERKCLEDEQEEHEGMDAFGRRLFFNEHFVRPESCHHEIGEEECKVHIRQRHFARREVVALGRAVREIVHFHLELKARGRVWIAVAVEERVQALGRSLLAGDATKAEFKVVDAVCPILHDIRPREEHVEAEAFALGEHARARRQRVVGRCVVEAGILDIRLGEEETNLRLVNGFRIDALVHEHRHLAQLDGAHML